MAETIDNDECDRCDGIFKKSSENNDNVESKADCNTVNEGQLEKTDLVEEFSILPSHPTSKETQSHTVVDVTDTLVAPSSAINSPITVGDGVTIFDCPGYWSWASPFTVVEIEGNMAALEMVDELIEIGRLERYQRIEQDDLGTAEKICSLTSRQSFELLCAD